MIFVMDPFEFEETILDKQNGNFKHAECPVCERTYSYKITDEKIKKSPDKFVYDNKHTIPICSNKCLQTFTTRNYK